VVTTKTAATDPAFGEFQYPTAPLGTSESGFRDEVEAEQALARGHFLADLATGEDHIALTGPAAAEAEQRIAAFAARAVFEGRVVTDEARLRRIMPRHDPKVYPGTFVTCVYNPDRALCRAGHSETGGPTLADCQPLACRNSALTATNRAALAAHAAELEAALASGNLLAPYVRHRLTEQHEQTQEFLTRYAPEPM
jgi:hypothetical protein